MTAHLAVCSLRLPIQYIKKTVNVGGAIFTDNFSAKQYISDKKEDLKILRNSKYIQSDATGFYKEVKSILQRGDKVLICGLPCQIAALKSYLKCDYDNLITVDLICRGINSPMVFRKYLESLVRKYSSKIIYIKHKSKELGWKKLTLKVALENGQTYYGPRDTDAFTRMFIGTSAITRPSCFECRFKSFPRVADISIGDYWYNKKTEAGKLDDDLGTSVVLINSKKGEAFFSEVKKITTSTDTLENVIAGNQALVKSLMNDTKINREKFYQDLQNVDFVELAEKYFPRNDIKTKIKNILRVIIKEAKLARLRPKPIWQFLHLNFLHPAVRGVSLSKERVIYVTRFCDIEISKEAHLNLKGSLTIGTSVYKHTRLETRLRMLSGAIFNVNGSWSYGYGGNIEIFGSGELTVERGPWANINLCIICQNKIFIDEWAMVGRAVTIRDNNGGHAIGIYGYRNSLPVHIGKHVWLCSNVTVMPGIKVGDGTVVGANSIVTSSFPANCIVSGNPAKITKTNVLWKM